MAEVINPAMLTLARESRGMTQGHLAAEVGVSQGKVSKFEGGMLAVPAAELERIARALDYPPDFFVQQDEVRAVGSGCQYHRKRQSMPVGELRAIHARMNVTRMQIARLLRGADVEAENRFPRIDVDECAGGPAEIARLVRRDWGLPPGPVAHLVRSVEAAGGIVVWCDFGTRKLDAITQCVPGLPPLFFLNRACPVDRTRFSLAHEIGHVVMHRIMSEDGEKEADTFASEFLMPEVDVRGQLAKLTIPKAAILKTHWRVSIAALIRRGRDLGVITDSVYRRLYTEMTQAGYKTEEPNPLTAEGPTVLSDLVRVHLEDHAYSTKQLANLLLTTEHNLFAQYLPERTFLRLAREV
jgi:Zn-dependent peptidase ImmA (M78 family)/DNA-binding Xre family transcriptional regulator